MFNFQVLYEESRVIIYGREAVSMYFYYDVRYDIMMYFRCESYMGRFMSPLEALYSQSLIIIT